MSNRISYLLAVILLLLAGTLRLWDFSTLPAGLTDDEVIDIRITETVRSGSVEVFYDLGGEGREGLYNYGLTFVTALVGKGPLGYRVFSAWVGLLSVACVYALGRRLFGHIAGLGAMGVMAVGFWPVLLSRQITPHTLIPFLVLVILLCLTLTLPVYRRRRWRSDNTSAATLLGFFLGVTLYIHPVGLVVVVINLVFIGYMIASPQQLISRRRLSYIGFALLLMVIIAMPYVISTLRIPELSGLNRLLSGEPLDLLAPLKSLAGLFIVGDRNPANNLPTRPMFDPLTGLLMLLGLWITVRKYKEPRYSLMLLIIIALSPVYLFSASAPNFLNYTAILPILALLGGLGIAQIRQLQYGRVLAVLTVLVLVGLNFQLTVQDLFQRWATHPEVEVAYHADLGMLAQYIDRRADDTPLVLCGWVAEQSPDAMQLTEAQMIGLMRNHKGAPIRQVDCYNALVMTNGGDAQQVIFPSTHALEHAHPQVMNWLTYGQILQIEGVPTYTIMEMDVENPLADRIGLFTIENRVQYASAASPLPDDRANTPVNFGGNVTFLGYIPDEEVVYQPGDTVTVTTYWRVDGMVPPDLLIFSHILIDPDASPLVNRDVISLDPRQLRNRDVFVQVTQIELPESVPPGEYALSVGAYQSTSGERLRVQEDGQETGDRLFLYNIAVQPEEA